MGTHYNYNEVIHSAALHVVAHNIHSGIVAHNIHSGIRFHVRCHKNCLLLLLIGMLQMLHLATLTYYSAPPGI